MKEKPEREVRELRIAHRNFRAVAKILSGATRRATYPPLCVRSSIARAELDELLSERDKINARLQAILDSQTDPWGVKVSAVWLAVHTDEW